MKTFRVKEKVLVTGWTYVKAESIEEAEDKLNRGDSYDFREEDSKIEDTDWKTLQEVTK